jgi:hypothetical protein
MSIALVAQRAWTGVWWWSTNQEVSNDNICSMRNYDSRMKLVGHEVHSVSVQNTSSPSECSHLYLSSLEALGPSRLRPFLSFAHVFSHTGWGGAISSELRVAFLMKDDVTRDKTYFNAPAMYWRNGAVSVRPCHLSNIWERLQFSQQRAQRYESHRLGAAVAGHHTPNTRSSILVSYFKSLSVETRGKHRSGH